jgi:hypothetical protein
MEINLRHYLIDWLNEHGLKELGKYDIRVSEDPRYPGLYNLKYGCISADKNEPIVRACRGAVVEEVLNDGDHSPYFRLVAYAFDRFFNYGESGADEIDWDTAKIYEKYDGSLIKLFYHRGEWVVSTSGSVGGAGNVGESGLTFQELFWDAFWSSGYDTGFLDTSYCYVFELCAPENRIVVKYEERMLRLLTVRDRSRDFIELPLEQFDHLFETAESYNFGGWQLVEEVNARGVDHEGFIVCDANGNRIKVKSDVYVQLHRVRGNGEPDFSELYLNGDLEEFLLHFPEYGEKFNGYVEKLDDIGFFVNGFVKLYSEYSQKEFAGIVLENHPNVSGAMFGIRSGKYRDFAHFVEDMKPKQLDRLLGL